MQARYDSVMIAQLSGRVVRHESNALVVDVAGVGYRVHTTTTHISTHPVGCTLLFATHLVVREDALELFGFVNVREVRLFELLIGVPGIGPRSALAIMNLAPADVLSGAIARGDTSYLTKVSGIGAKNAQKIIVELKDKLRSDVGATTNAESAEDVEVIDALVALGYSLTEARNAVGTIPHETYGAQHRLKEALKVLGSRA